MSAEQESDHRLAGYSDAVFAVIVTIMVLELKAPEQAAFSALRPLWPTAVTYAVSYLFIAVIWINHHYLLRQVRRPTLGLMWMNFIHLFLVSLLPFATAWVARTSLASPPVVFYAALFVGIDIAYNVFERDVLAHADAGRVSLSARRLARRRSLVVLGMFASAALVACFAREQDSASSPLRCSSISARKCRPDRAHRFEGDQSSRRSVPTIRLPLKSGLTASYHT